MTAPTDPAGVARGRRRDFEPLAPACMKCEAVTGQSTCFPGPCRFFHERGIAGTKAHAIATIDQVRRGMRDTVHAAHLTPDAPPTSTPTPEIR